MSFYLQGYVLKPARLATGNSSNTGESKTNVSREHITPAKMTALGYDSVPTVPIEPYADMYKVAVLDSPEDSIQYAVFAATNSMFSTIEENTSVTSILNVLNVVTPLNGSLTVGAFQDGTVNFAVQDEESQSLSSVSQLILVRGDTSSIVICTSFSSQNPQRGSVELTPSDKTLLGGGFSAERGDTILQVSYLLAAPKYYWSRNDNRKTRFFWNGAEDRWVPIKGSMAQNLGQILEDSEYKLNPPLKRFSVNEVLPFPASTDDYAILRYGLYADSTSEVLNCLVISDTLVDAGVWRSDLGWNTYDAVVGVTNGVLILNPTFISSEAGVTLWYNAEDFNIDNNGILSQTQILDSDTNINHPVLSPIPEPGEYPFVRIGYRTYLEGNPVENDAGLLDPTSITEGQFYYSLTTGKTSFSRVDINKAKPSKSEYQKSYLLSKIYYDGVVLSSKPTPIRKPVACINKDGDPLDANPEVITSGTNWVPLSVPLPPPGVSGVMLWEDGSGDLPKNSPDPQTRPNGSGLRRKINLGDSFFFNSESRFVITIVEEYEEDLSLLPLSIKSDEVEVSRMKSLDQPPGYTDTSKLKLKKRKAKGESLYLIQTGLSPSSYQDKAKIYSRLYEPYAFLGTEVFTFVLDGGIYNLNLPQGSYTASEVAVLLNAVLPSNTCGSFRGRVFIANSDTSSGSVEIGYNADHEDLSGHAVLGFLPTWRIEPSNPNFRWLPDTGSFLELFRSPTNLDGSEPFLDCTHIQEINGENLLNSIPEIEFTPVDYIPLEDLPGYSDGVHFKTQVQDLIIPLPNYGTNNGFGVKYDFDEQRIIWTQVGNTSQTQKQEFGFNLLLDDPDLLTETLSSDSMGGTFGLYYTPISGVMSELIAGQEYLTLDGGDSGNISLISVVSSAKEIGAGGEGSGSQFSNPKYTNDNTQNSLLQQNLYDNVEVGYLLEIQNTNSIGVYTITSKQLSLGNAVFGTSPPFPETFTGGLWKIYNAEQYSQLDEGLLVDVKGIRRNHFPEEPFKINLLSLTGEYPSSLNADVNDAILLGRETVVRVGLPAGSPELFSVFLEEGIEVGVAQASGLLVPDLTDAHFTESSGSVAYFQIRVGGEKYNTTLGNLTLNSGVTPTTVDVNTSTGEILIGTDILVSLSSSTVYYDQLFRDPANFTGLAEISPSTGDINVPSVTLNGSKIYFLERLITESFQDVTISPFNGGIYLSKALKKGQIVEADYFLANSSGDKKLDEDGNTLRIIEFLAHVVRLEQCVRVDDFTYSFNPEGKTPSSEIDPFVWVGSELQNYAGQETATFDFTNNTITFKTAVEVSTIVKLNYGVLEATGGEQSLSVTTPPVYRKPFFLDKGSSSFTLETDRTQDFGLGKLMLVGVYPFYITNSVYDTSTDTTTVEIYPPAPIEVGSRSPGRDNLLATTDFPVDVSYGGVSGFMLNLSATYLPLARGGLEVIFYGDITSYATSEHILEVGGIPYIISNSELSEDGSYTTVSISTGIINDTIGQALRISSRPVYTNLSSFKVPNLPVSEEGVELFLIGRTDSSGSAIPGKRLIQGLEYELVGEGVSFLAPYQKAMKPHERLHMAYTKYVSSGPEINNNAIVTPLYKGKYLHIISPDKKNRLAGAKLFGKYKFLRPDCYFYDIVPLTEYLPTVACELISGASGGGTGFAVANGSADPSEQGVLGTRGEVQGFQNQDRAARTYIELYNKVIVSFEQILETMDGRIIGDRDGKFRNFVGHGRKYSPPGWEDEFTGNINPRLVWREILETWADASLLLDGYYTEADPVVDPTTAFEKDPTNRPGDVDGKTPDPATLSSYIAMQRMRIKNDMEDRILVGFANPRFLAALFPSIDVPGRFKYMWEPQAFSRLFPERTKHFSRLFPGVEAVLGLNGYTDFGFYTPGRTVTKAGPVPGEEEEVKVKTKNTTIGTISNPAIGKITGIVDVTAQERLARARVWAFYPEGNQEFDNVVGTTTVGKATLVLTPVPLSQFPTELGFPDPTRLISQGGQTLDITSGDNTLSNPPFEVGQRINYGKTNGSSYNLLVGDSGVYVEEVQLGCVITLMDSTGTSVIGSDIVVNSTSNLTEVVSQNNGLGDTTFVVVPDSFEQVPADDEAATVEELAEIAQGIPDFRIQFDLKVDKRTGEFIDGTLPTKEDNFPINLQSLFGQKPPAPLTAIEGEVSFVNSSSSPLNLPCLLGQDKDDSGDNQIPYIKGSGSEITILSRIAGDISLLFEDITYTPKPSVAGYSSPYAGFGYGTIDYQYWDTAYPDEWVINDGVYYPTQDGTHDPASLYTNRNLRVISGTGMYQENSAVGSVRKGDLMLVEVNQSQLPYHAFEGILTVGDVFDFSGGETKVDLPRFVSHTDVGRLHKYTARNYSGHKGLGTTGTEITETVGAHRRIDFNFSSVSNFILTNEFGLISGNDNVFTINIFDPSLIGSGYKGSITFQNPSAGSGFWTIDAGGVVVANGLTGIGLAFTYPNSLFFEMNPAAASPLALLGITPGNKYDYTLTMDTYIDSVTNTLTGNNLTEGGGSGSITCGVLRDKLTFKEGLDFGSCFPRNTQPADSSAFEMGLEFDLALFTEGSEWKTNSKVETNNNSMYTLLERVGPDPQNIIGVGVPYVGAFDAVAVLGFIRMMPWERGGNITWGVSNVEDIKISFAPSSDIAQKPDPVDTPITYGGGKGVDEGFYSLSTDWEITGPTTWIQDCYSLSDLAQIQAGDITIINSGRSKDGTYIVRHTVPDSNGLDEDGNNVLSVKGFANAGTKSSFDLRFPQIKSINQTFPNYEILLKNVQPVPGSPTGHGFPATTFKLYIITKDAYASYSGGAYTVDPNSVVSVDVQTASYDANTKELSCTNLTGGKTATGTALGLSDFLNLLNPNQNASGMHYFKIGRITEELPENNCVGAHSLGAEALVAGFRYLTLGNLSSFHPSSPSKTYYSGAAEIQNKITGTNVAGTIAIDVPLPTSSNVFIPDIEEVIYARQEALPKGTTGKIGGVAQHIDLSQISTAQWNLMHFQGVSPTTSLNCLLPKDRFVTGNDLNPGLGLDGFVALQGIFFEPSFPKPTTAGYSVTFSNDPRVVTQNNPFGATPNYLIGMRQTQDFSLPVQYTENVTFIVRRIRRWHEAQSKISSIAEPLKYLYEMRRGTTSSSSGKTFTALSSLTGATNLGDFTNTDVNINAGDILRLFNTAGELVAESEIKRIVSSTVLELRQEVPTLASGTFEVYLKQPSVPHEQSLEELLAFITKTVVYERKLERADPAELGGLSPEFNKMQDSGISDWSSVGVQEGDIVVIDPQGGLYLSNEFGYRPNGDLALTSGGSDRVAYYSDTGTVIPVYTGGSPDELDDNRGFYFIGELDEAFPETLAVDGTNRFAGGTSDGSDNVLFGEVVDYLTGEDYRYVLLPTVSASTLPTGATEGQQSLRPTSPPVGSSYNSRGGYERQKSIEPFSYKIIRPNNVLSRDGIELVLFMRERNLSWIENIRRLYDGTVSGTYYIFQRDDHILDVGSPLDPSSGAGVIHNGFMQALQGMVDFAPYVSSTDCLSILGRRVHIQDYNLDLETPIGVPLTYTKLGTNEGEQRPLYPDYIEDVLSLEDNLRGQRYAWLNTRSNLSSGSAIQAQRAEERLPEELKKEEELVQQMKGASETGGSSC